MKHLAVLVRDLFAPSRAWDAVDYLALDLETGGVDARRDPLIAVGVVPIRGGVIRVGEASASLVRPTAPIQPASMRAHQLVPRDLAAAPAVTEVAIDLARRMAGAVLILHHASLDLAFLRAAFATAGLAWPHPRVVDTVDLLMRLERRRRLLPEAAPVPLALGAARAALGLPPHDAHDALSDALATAELFLVLRHRLDARTVRSLIRWRRG